MKRPSVWLLLILLSASLSTPAIAQDVGFGGTGHRASVFADFTAARTGQGAGYVWGGGAGAYVQGRILGLMARATVLPGNNDIHLYDAVLGPRLALTLPFVRAWIDAGAGMGYTGGYYSSPTTLGTQWGAAWQADAGISHAILPRLDWRILEIGYGRIYTGTGVSPLMASTGLTLHIW
jgi:hypothetical protein